MHVTLGKPGLGGQLSEALITIGHE
jgi:hypothetical protein